MRLLLISLAVLFAPLFSATGSFASLGVSDGLGNRKVYQVRQDAAGYLWFYTQGSIDRYDGFEFRRYILPPEAVEGNFLATSNTLVIDCDGVLNVIQTNGRAYRYDKGSDAFEPAFSFSRGALFSVLFCPEETWLGTSEGLFRLSSGEALLQNLSVNCLARHGDRIYAGTDDGIWVLSGNSCIRMPESPSTKVTALLPLDDGRLFAGTFSDGAFYLKGGRSYALPKEFPRVPVRTVIRDEERLLFGTDGSGVVIYGLEEQKVTGRYEDTADGLCANTVSDLFMDSDGVLWVTTTTSGISYLDRGRINPSWIRPDHVNTVFEDHEGRIWMGTNKGLHRFDGTGWHDFDTPGADVILDLAEDADGTIWAGGYGFPVFGVDRSDHIKTLVPGRFQYSFALAVQDNTLWIGDIDDPLTGISLDDGTGREYGEKEIWDLFPGDSLWVASHSGLGVAGPGDTLVRWLSLPQGVTGSWCITQDRSGCIWAGMESGGIVSYDPSSGSMRHYPLDETVFCILPDASGCIWAVSGEKVYRLDPQAGVPVVMNNLLGLSSGEFNHTASARLRNGYFILGSANGALMFDPESIAGVAPSAVTPVITSFRLLSSDAGRILRGRAVDTYDKLVLNWDERSFALSYSALSLRAHARLRLEYLMEGYDKVPSGSLSAGTVEYKKMPAGHYTFTVKAIDSLTGAEMGTRHLHILVRRHALLSAVAMSVYAAVLAIAAVFFIRYRRRRHLRRLTQERLDTFIHFAHELKTPVSLIKAPLTTLDKDEALPREERESVSLALRNTDRLMNMINSLLDLRDGGESFKALALEKCDLRDYLGETLNAFSPAARLKGIELSHSVADGLDEVLLDREKMDHILQNLVSNAIKYTETGSVTVSAKPAGRLWRMEVKDTGIGIPADVRSRIFYGGIRAANARSMDETGYGIGLLITRQLVLQHSGTITIESEEGRGTTFHLEFPREYKASAGKVIQDDASGPEVEETPSGSTRPRILIVEDDSEMLSYLRDLLGQEYEILTVPDGAGAISMAEENQPDLVLSDVIMPGMNGFELCRHLKSALPTSHIPVILLTAMDDREHVIMGLESGSDDYIVKPFDPKVLRVRVSNLLSERERLRNLILRSGRKEKQLEYTNRLDKEFMEKVLAVVESSYSDPEFQIDDLCRAVAMSRTAFFNKLKGLAGTGPNDFIRIYRLEKAKQLLEAGEYTIAEVSDMVGFSDAKYFSSCFKKAFGVSPSKY